MIGVVAWDFDGTIADSAARSLDATRQMFAVVTGGDPDLVQCLKSVSFYNRATETAKDWRELFTLALGISEADIERAGDAWSRAFTASLVPVLPRDGLRDCLEGLHTIRHGILSQAHSDRIESWLREHRLESEFAVVVGADRLTPAQQKPAGEALATFLDLVRAPVGTDVAVVGDHEGDFTMAARARVLLPNTRIVAVGVDSSGCARSWRTQPDLVVEHLAALPAEICALDAR